MEVQQHQSKKFQKSLIVLAAQVVVYSCFATSSALANAPVKGNPISKTTRYLDPSVWSITVNENDCFLAAPRSILQVEPMTSDKGYRVYKISQYFDIARERMLYAQPLEDQIKNHKVVGREFCGGIVSISDMDLPFTKGNKLQDANDGLLLTDAVRHDMVNINKQLLKMTQLATQASSGTNSSMQLSLLNDEFQTYLGEIEHIANKSSFNGIALLNGDTGSIAIPIDGASFISVSLTNATTGSAGLNIAHLHIRSNYEAQNALAELSGMTAIDVSLNNVKTDSIKLEEAAQNNAETTFIDVRTDDFTVQHQKSSLIKKSHN